MAGDIGTVTAIVDGYEVELQPKPAGLEGATLAIRAKGVGGPQLEFDSIPEWRSFVAGVNRVATIMYAAADERGASTSTRPPAPAMRPAE